MYINISHKWQPAFVAILLCTVSLSLSAQSGWRLQKSASGLNVYFKQSAKHEYQIKVSGKFNASPACVLREIKNIEDYPEWVSHCKTSEWIDREQFIYYSVTDIPWPFNDRDVISKVNVKERDSEIQIDFHSIPDYIPEKEDIERIQRSEAHWRIKKTSQGHSRITYRLVLYIEVNIPSSFMRIISTQAPYESMLKLKERVERY